MKLGKEYTTCFKEPAAMRIDFKLLITKERKREGNRERKRKEGGKKGRREGETKEEREGGRRGEEKGGSRGRRGKDRGGENRETLYCPLEARA